MRWNKHKIASVRIHVERAIQRIKQFRILKEQYPVDMFPNIDKIMHVCTLLVNLSNL